jgi:aryl-alcohol dehydrogenase-like predicted oxidoreductase
MSNYAAWQICEALWRSSEKGWPVPVVTQVPYNLLARGIEQELVPFCTRLNVGITVYNPLAGGLLTGKHSQEQGPEKGSRFDRNQEYRRRYWVDSNFDALGQLGRIAQEAGLSLIQLAFRWLLSQLHVDSVILGVSKVAHLEENLQAADGTLDEPTLAACDQVWSQIRGDSFQYNR